MKEYCLSWQKLIPSVLYITLLLISNPANSDSATLEQGKSFYFNGQYDKAIEKLLTVANKQNNAEAQYYVGLIYSLRDTKYFNITDSLKYLLSSSDQNYAPAMWKIGDLHENDPAGSNNLVVATDWYRKAKQSEKKQRLIQFFKDTPPGELKPVSNNNVINALTEKAENGNTEALLKLAIIYDDGVLTQQDDTRAFKWYMKAAENNNQHAQFMVGYFLCRGIGTSYDLKASTIWLKKSGREANCTEQ